MRSAGPGWGLRENPTAPSYMRSSCPQHNSQPGLRGEEGAKDTGGEEMQAGGFSSAAHM